MEYTELQITSNFTFLRGGSHPEELVEQALALGYTEIAITDFNTLAGVVRAYTATKGKDIRIIPGCRLELRDGHSLLTYPKTKEGYANLSGLLSEGNLRAEKGKCFLYKKDVYAFAKDLLFVMVPPMSLNAAFEIEELFIKSLAEYKKQLGDYFYLGVTRSYHANDTKKLFRLAELSRLYKVPLVAMNDVHYHAPARRELQDVLTCIREKCTITNAGFKLYQNAERYLKTAEEMNRLFAQYPEAITNTKKIADACRFSLGELKYTYPKGLTTEGRSHQEELAHHTWIGAHKMFGEQIPEKVKKSIEFELSFIKRKELAPYFLTVFDYVWEARRLGILCQGRGSAANSVVCYSLGITSVDPMKHRLLFSRFMSDARDEPPDIDVDFEHDRREEIIQYIYKKYGREHSAIVATVTQVHFKGAIRDVGKAMGLSLDAIDNLASSGWEFTEEWLKGNEASSKGFNAKDPFLLKVLELTNQYRGFPRQLGQHTGGFVLTDGKISDLCPTLNARMENRTNIEWNKDDIESLGILKVDVLALGMLTCIRICFDLAKLHYNLDLTLANIPQDDSKVYDMICKADTIGVFQIESRAQMSMSPRMKARCFYDLVMQIAMVRPGPIQGGAVNPLLRRRNEEEPIIYPSKELKEILGRTMGVVLFQEQAMEVAIIAGGFTDAEADQLRRSMASFKADGKVGLFEDKLVKGMMAKGYTEEYSKNTFKQLRGFSGYGFPESHSSSFALLAYVSAWLKCHYPDVFAAGLLNSQPMGFYQPAQIISCAKNHGVTVRPVDINFSNWDNVLEERVGKYYALRLGFREVQGLREEEIQLLVAVRETLKNQKAEERIQDTRQKIQENKTQTPAHRIAKLLDAGISVSSLELLANADAFRSIGLDRRKALWEISALKDYNTGLFAGQAIDATAEKDIVLPEMNLSQHVLEDYKSTGLSLKAHPVSFIRNKLSELQVTANKEIVNLTNGSYIKVSGLVLVRQRPGTASGICFITIEDETGIANLVVFEKLFTKYRKEIVRSRFLMVEGTVQKEGEVIHIIVKRCYNLTGLLMPLGNIEANGSEDQSEDYQVSRYMGAENEEKELVKSNNGASFQYDVFHGGRNFH
jgi:error-prone DNA polymerase